MLQWIKARLRPGNALERQLGSARALARYIAALPLEDPGATLEAVSAVFEQAAALDLSPGMRLRALAALDESAREARSELSGRLLANVPKQDVDETPFARVLHHYGVLATGYAHALDSFSADGERDAEAYAFATLAAARAIHALAKSNMLQRMRYRESPADLWRRVEALFAAARKDAQAAAQLELYPGDEHATSIQSEYLVAALLEVAPVANMLPAQVHALDLLLRRHAAHCRIAETYDELSTPFCVNALGDARPLRCLSPAGAKPGTRFFGLGDAHARLQAEREQAAAARSVPGWLQASQVSVERYRELLELLAVHWSAQRPRRTQRREPAAGDLLAAHDFSLVRRLVRFTELAASGRSAEYDRTVGYTISGMVLQHAATREAQTVPDELALRHLANLEGKLDPGLIETWRIVDVSADGLGAVVPGPADWARAGMLIAYRDPASPRWALAIVRRLGSGSGGGVLLGMRKLAGSGASTRLNVNDSRQAGGRSAAGPSLHYDAIRLEGGASALLLPPGVFNPTWGYTLSSGPHWESIRLRRCIECGFDFELVEYTAREQERAA